MVVAYWRCSQLSFFCPTRAKTFQRFFVALNCNFFWPSSARKLCKFSLLMHRQLPCWTQTDDLLMDLNNNSAREITIIKFQQSIHSCQRNPTRLFNQLKTLFCSTVSKVSRAQLTNSRFRSHTKLWKVVAGLGWTKEFHSIIWYTLVTSISSRAAQQ